MNLFRSEDNVFEWSQNVPEEGGGVMTIEQLNALFSGNAFRRRLDPDYFAKFPEYFGELLGTMLEAGLTGPAFLPPQD